jgi:hypothetical protein
MSLGPQSEPPRIISLGWALRRAAFGLVLLLTLVMMGAWLLYASIDPDEATAAGSPAQSERAAQQR